MVVVQFLPLTLGMALEELQLELISVFAVRLGEVQLAVENALMTVYLVLSSLMLGLGSATTIRVAHWLGAGRPVAARRTSIISFWCSLCVGFFTGLMFIVLRDYIGQVFSADAEVHALTSQVCLLLGPCFFILSALYTAFSVLDAQARPMVVALAFVIGGWMVSVPMSYVFAFTLGDGLIGLWYGMTLGYSGKTPAPHLHTPHVSALLRLSPHAFVFLCTAISVISGIAVVLSDWKDCSVQAMIRSRKEKDGEAAGEGEEDEEEGEQEDEGEDEDKESVEGAEEQKKEQDEERKDPGGHIVAVHAYNDGEDAEEEDDGDGEEEAEYEEEEEEEEGEEDLEEGEEEDQEDEEEDAAEEKFVSVSMRSHAGGGDRRTTRAVR